MLGGSSPFTAGLVLALAARGARFAGWHLVLHGRHEERLRTLTRFASARLAPCGWQVTGTTAIEPVLDGAGTVLHQVRYGGLALRARGEELCHEIGVAADETLGPEALLTGIKSVPGLTALADQLRRRCPGAWILNLTNPLSATTVFLSRRGVERCFGLCELPGFTAQRIASLLEVNPAQLTWSYSGLNHRGFIHGVRVGGRDLIPDLLHELEGRTFEGVSAATIERLGAVPLKYFRFLELSSPPPAIGRAAYLDALRDRLLHEMEAGLEGLPSLRDRYMEWYPGAVVPMFEALETGSGEALVATFPEAGGLGWERRVQVMGSRIEILPGDPPPATIVPWLDIFREHERRFLEAMENPSEESVRAVCEADPLIPQERKRSASLAIEASLQILEKEPSWRT